MTGLALESVTRWILGSDLKSVVGNTYVEGLSSYSSVSDGTRDGSAGGGRESLLELISGNVCSKKSYIIIIIIIS